MLQVYINFTLKVGSIFTTTNHVGKGGWWFDTLSCYEWDRWKSSWKK